MSDPTKGVKMNYKYRDLEVIKNFAIDSLGYSEEDFQENDSFWAKNLLTEEEYQQAIEYSN